MSIKEKAKEIKWKIEKWVIDHELEVGFYCGVLTSVGVGLTIGMFFNKNSDPVKTVLTPAYLETKEKETDEVGVILENLNRFGKTVNRMEYLNSRDDAKRLGEELIWLSQASLDDIKNSGAWIMDQR